MLSYKVLRFVTWLMTFSLGYLIGELLIKKYSNENDKKFLKYARVVLGVLSFGTFIWLLLNKELFHWNFDIATGEPVDHYSTYGKCIIYAVIALISNVISYIVAKMRKERSK